MCKMLQDAEAMSSRFLQEANTKEGDQQTLRANLQSGAAVM
jgi:hypothetical protein